MRKEVGSNEGSWEDGGILVEKVSYSTKKSYQYMFNSKKLFFWWNWTYFGKIFW